LIETALQANYTAILNKSEGRFSMKADLALKVFSKGSRFIGFSFMVINLKSDYVPACHQKNENFSITNLRFEGKNLSLEKANRKLNLNEIKNPRFVKEKLLFFKVSLLERASVFKERKFINSLIKTISYDERESFPFSF